MRAGKKCWVLSDGTVGMEKQSLALAEGVGLPVTLKRVSIRQPWRTLPARAWLAPFRAVGPASDPIAAPWPDLLVSTGGRVVALCTAIRRLSGGRTCAIHIQNPRVGPAAFDLVIAPRHDRLSGPNVLETHGSLHAVTAAALQDARIRFAPLAADLPTPLVTVLLGGNSRRHNFTSEAADRLGHGLVKLTADGAGLLITASRRTPPEALDRIRRHLTGTAHFLWDGQGENPYLGLLGLADALVVTNDSVNMLSEAAATGKAVHVFALAGGSIRFDRFLDHMREMGITRPFAGTLEIWTYTPPDDTERAIEAVRQLLARQS